MALLTVTGEIPVESVRLADAHAHAWIEPPEGVAAEARLELCDETLILSSLRAFRAGGGTLLVDCQPGGCGRNAARLAKLSRASGVYITATTGFHRAVYYPPGHRLWSASEEQAAAHFLKELTHGVDEAPDVRATTIKVGYEGRIAGQVEALMSAAAAAARRSGAALLFHTERGRGVEALLPFFAARGVPPERLYLCHMDKRPDLALHRELAQAGVLLGYDTFLRPTYRPEQNVWPLLEALVEGGLARHIALGLDLAQRELWRPLGLLALPQLVVPRLYQRGFDAATVADLCGQNVARFLAWHRL